MRQLVLLRHAKAAVDSDTGQDFDRPLAPRGREDAPVVGKALADAGAEPELALVSAAKRTRETWELVSAAFPGVEARFLDELYDATAETLLHLVEHAKVARLMIVGHNPGLQELAIRLARRNTPLDAAVRAKFPTCAAALYSRKDDLGALKLQEFITPKTISD
jgi:phosphohistidine phosphatase